MKSKKCSSICGGRGAATAVITGHYFFPIVDPEASPTPPFGSGGGLTGSGSYGTGAGSSVNCGGTYTLGKGEITSPSYPYNYPSNAYCKYILEQPEGATITLEFVDMNIENVRFEDEDGNIRCNYDYVEVSQSLHIC